jgi:hypothetical protein
MIETWSIMRPHFARDAERLDVALAMEALLALLSIGV